MSTAGAAAPRARRARRKGSPARRSPPDPGPPHAPGLGPDQRPRISLRTTPRAARSRRATTRRASLRGAPGPVLAPLTSPEPSPNPSPSPGPPLLPKLAPAPDPPRAQSPAPSPAPSLDPALAPAPSPGPGLCRDPPSPVFTFPGPPPSCF